MSATTRPTGASQMTTATTCPDCHGEKDEYMLRCFDCVRAAAAKIPTCACGRVIRTGTKCTKCADRAKSTMARPIATTTPTACRCHLASSSISVACPVHGQSGYDFGNPS